MAKLKVLLAPRFLGALKDLSDSEIARIEQALRMLPDCFGQPHAHSGISIRRLKNSIFECRAGLRLRILFRVGPQTLEVLFVGGHDDVRQFIRNF